MRDALVCLSGGVDSTAAMLLSLRSHGSARALFIDMRGDGPPREAVEAAERLGVPILVEDARKAFRETVLQSSEVAYGKGLTPNPCILCNARVKLALAFSILGRDEDLVTGHYANIADSCLSRGADPLKDQSYFLSMVPIRILSRCSFPLGRLCKTEVRAMVSQAGLPFLSRESQDLCASLKRLGEPGDVVTVEGEAVGRHQGLGGFTIGQRKGIGAHGARMYVVRLEPSVNRVVVGTAEHLRSTRCMVAGVNDLCLPADGRFEAMVQVRSRHRAVHSVVRPVAEGYSVEFETPQKAVAPGQTAAFYMGSKVAGAGVIMRTEG